jgi:translation elongation factor EF-1alpha
MEVTIMDEAIGVVTHYYGRIGVAVLDISGELHLGDTIMIQGHTTDFTQQVNSLELNHHKIQFGGPGMEVALKVIQPVRRGDKIFKIAEPAEE